MFIVVSRRYRQDATNLQGDLRCYRMGPRAFTEKRDAVSFAREEAVKRDCNYEVYEMVVGVDISRSPSIAVVQERRKPCP